MKIQSVISRCCGRTDTRKSQLDHQVSYCPRRCKMAFVGTFIFTLFLVALLNSGIGDGRVVEQNVQTSKSCRTSEIPLQEDFDASAFEGLWYTTYTKGLENSVFAYFINIYDIRAKFILKKDKKSFDIRSVGSMFYGWMCPRGIGYADVTDDTAPQKFDIHFDTPTGKKFGHKPMWLLKTDYESYAVVYSCWETGSDGACLPSKTYGAVMSRTKTAPTDKMAEIRAAFEDACINPDTLQPSNHYGYCLDDDYSNDL